MSQCGFCPSQHLLQTQEIGKLYLHACLHVLHFFMRPVFVASKCLNFRQTSMHQVFAVVHVFHLLPCCLVTGQAAPPSQSQQNKWPVFLSFPLFCHILYIHFSVIYILYTLSYIHFPPTQTKRPASEAGGRLHIRCPWFFIYAFILFSTHKKKSSSRHIHILPLFPGH